MILRRLLLLVLTGAVVALAATIVLSRGGDTYMVRVELANADGLRAGRPVMIGGAQVGTVDDVYLGHGDTPIAVLALDPRNGRIGSGASAQVMPTNLLGEVFLNLHPGDLSHPQPSGVTLPDSRTSEAVDLDQVLNVLDADTRVRLGILINEAGLALSGRKADFNQWLQLLPPSLQTGARLLEQLDSENATLGALVDHAQSFVSYINDERGSLNRAITSMAGTLATASARRAQLAETWDRAPQALVTLRSFLTSLDQTTAPLYSASRALTASSGPLATTLAELEPFREAAQPTLEQLNAIAPTVTQLADQATPVLSRAIPTLNSLASLANNVSPITQMLDHGTPNNPLNGHGVIDDLLDATDTWAQAIQGRDGASHFFRGYIVFGPEVIRQLLQRNGLLGGTSPTTRTVARPPAEAEPPRPPVAAPSSPAPTPASAPPAAGKPPSSLAGLLSAIGAAVPKPSSPTGQGPLSNLLHFLLGR